MSRRCGALYRLLIFMLFGCPALATATDYPIVERMCITDSGMPRIGKPAPVPIGCLMAGCLETGVYEWRITVDAKLLDGIELRFERLGANDLGQLQYGGGARLEGERIIVGPGAGRISNIPDKAGGTVNVVTLAPILRDDASSRLQSMFAGDGSAARGEIVDRITVEQFDGRNVVNRYEWTYAIRPCRDPTPSAAREQDTLIIEGTARGEKLDVLVMIDARRSASQRDQCRDGRDRDEWVQRFTGNSPLVIPLANLLAADGDCNSEIAVFSVNHRMYLEKMTWTDQPGDVRRIKLQPRIKVPVHIWTVSAEDRARAHDEISIANRLFVRNRVGVEFNPTFRSISAEQVALISKKKCQAVSEIRKAKRYIANALNIYYVPGYGDRNCAIVETPASCEHLERFAKADGNFMYLGSIPAPFTLAHELGHAFGLRPSTCWGHVNGLEAFGLENIMYGGTFEALLRKRFTLGQVFRMNTQRDRWGGTMLITNGLRRESDGRECRPDVRSDTCPLLNTDL